jgi:hypothetical protein
MKVLLTRHAKAVILSLRIDLCREIERGLSKIIVALLD